jgi:hypothetical protein
MIAQSPRWRGAARPFPARPDDPQQAGCQGPPRCALGPCLPVSPTISGVRWSMRFWESVRPRRSRRQGVPRSHGPAEESVNGTKVNFQLIARCLTTPSEARARGGDTSQFNPATGVRCLTTRSEARARSPGTSQLKTATWVRWLTTRFEARARSPATSQLDPEPGFDVDYSIRGPVAQPRHRNSTRNLGSMPDYSIRGPGAQQRHVTAQPGNPGSLPDYSIRGPGAPRHSSTRQPGFDQPELPQTSSDDREMRLCHEDSVIRRP